MVFLVLFFSQTFVILPIQCQVVFCCCFFVLFKYELFCTTVNMLILFFYYLFRTGSISPGIEPLNKGALKTLFAHLVERLSLPSILTQVREKAL